MALGVVLGPAGLALVGTMMAGIIGGMAGGALTGGLQGGWKGALIGGALGGALGGFGSWAGSLHNATGNTILGGMLAAGVGYAAATDSWDSLAGGLAGAAVGTGIGNAINQAMARAPNLAAQTGAARIGSGETKAAAQLTVDEKPANIVKRADPNLQKGMVRRFVGQREEVRILSNETVLSNNREGTYWTPDNIVTPDEAVQRLGIPKPYAAVDVPAQNFDAAKVVAVRQVEATGQATEIVYKGSVSVRGGRVIDFETMTEKTYVDGVND